MTTAKVHTSAHDGSIHIDVSGEIDLANAAAIEDEIRGAITPYSHAVALDLGGLTYMDSAGIRVLYRIASRLHALQIMLELIVPLDSPTRQLIELSGFESIATVRPARS